SSRRRHTRCYRDWSSDVCSSDLARRAGSARAREAARAQAPRRPMMSALFGTAMMLAAFLLVNLLASLLAAIPAPLAMRRAHPAQIGRASCRERVARWGRTGCDAA